jgi:CMP-N-acetylneuraminic acid synthetase
MDIFGVIPARSGSKGIKNKNIQKIYGKTLLEISIKKFKLLKQQKLIKDFIVSTDSKIYANLAKISGSKVQIRPKYLSGDKTRIIEVLNYIKKEYKYGYFITLVPTAPLIKVRTIKKLIKFFIQKKKNSIGTISNLNTIHPLLAMDKKSKDEFNYFVRGNFPRYPRQIRPKLYHYNGCIFIRNNNLIRKNNYKNNCLGKSFTGFEISKDESCNIDIPDDLNFCRNNFNAKKIYK